MKLTLPRYTLTILLSILSSSVFAGDWYSSIAYSYSKADLLPDGPPILQIEEDDNDTGWQLAFGYQYNRYFALEFGWADLGTRSAQITPSIGVAYANPDSPIPNISPSVLFTPSPGLRAVPSPYSTYAAFGNVDSAVAALTPIATYLSPQIEMETKGLRLAANGTLPIGEKFSLSMQAGFMFAENETRIVSYNLSIDTSTTPATIIRVPATNKLQSKDSELFAGLGARYNFNEKIAVKLFWERIMDLGGDQLPEQDMDVYNLALIYSF